MATATSDSTRAPRLSALLIVGVLVLLSVILAVRAAADGGSASERSAPQPAGRSTAVAAVLPDAVAEAVNEFLTTRWSQPASVEDLVAGGLQVPAGVSLDVVDVQGHGVCVSAWSQGDERFNEAASAVRWDSVTDEVLEPGDEADSFGACA